MHVVAHGDGVVVFLQASGSLLQMLVEEGLMVLQVLILGGLLRCLQLVCHWLRRVEVPDVRLDYVLLTLARERCGSALVLLIDLVQVNHLLIGCRIQHGLIRKGVQLVAGARDEGTVIELLSLSLHDVDELIAGEALWVCSLLASLIDLVGCRGVHASCITCLLRCLALLG